MGLWGGPTVFVRKSHAVLEQAPAGARPRRPSIYCQSLTVIGQMTSQGVADPESTVLEAKSKENDRLIRLLRAASPSHRVDRPPHGWSRALTDRPRLAAAASSDGRCHPIPGGPD